MANMPHSRFRNTLEDLRDCYDHLFDEGLSEEEERARRKLKTLCITIADELEDGGHEVSP